MEDATEVAGATVAEPNAEMQSGDAENPAVKSDENPAPESEIEKVELSVKDMFAAIEADAAALLAKIEAIPQGIAHGYHSLGAEIRARL